MPISNRDLRVPLGALVLLPQEQWDPYFNQLAGLPHGLRSLVTSSSSGYFLVGLLKKHDVAPDLLPRALLIILKTAFAEFALNELPRLFATELQIPSESAQAIATEIEKELFSPVLLDLNRFREQKKQLVAHQPPGQPTQPPPRPLIPQRPPFDRAQGKPLLAPPPKNVLDLKNKPAPPPLPR